MRKTTHNETDKLARTATRAATAKMLSAHKCVTSRRQFGHGRSPRVLGTGQFTCLACQETRPKPVVRRIAKEPSEVGTKQNRATRSARRTALLTCEGDTAEVRVYGNATMPRLLSPTWHGRSSVQTNENTGLSVSVNSGEDMRLQLCAKPVGFVSQRASQRQQHITGRGWFVGPLVKHS